jgi:hypothetical protein
MDGVDILLGTHTYMQLIRLTLDLRVSQGATLRVSAQHPATKRPAIPIEARNRVEDIAAIKRRAAGVKGESEKRSQEPESRRGDAISVTNGLGESALKPGTHLAAKRRFNIASRLF